MALLDLRCVATAALTGALLIVAAPAEQAAAQRGCTFGDQGNDILDQRTVPGRGTITYVTRPHFVCSDGVQIWADSAVAYSADAMSHLIGRVRYSDATRELTAAEARYFSDVGRLQAQGNLVVVNREDGSRVEHGDLVYLRRTEFREEESMTFTTGRDGRRPRAVVPPPEPDSTAVDSVAATAPAAAEPEASPYVVVGDRLFFRGSDSFVATGDVEIERDSLFAYADSADYAEAAESLLLVGSARVVSSDYTLVGRSIDLGTATEGTSEIRAVRDAILTGEDLRLTAPVIKLYLTDGAVERLVGVPLPPGDETEVGAPGQGGISPDQPPAPRPVAPDSLVEEASDPPAPRRPIAVAESFELTADSLELTAPAEVVERIFAAGRARSVSQARDSLNVDALPELARQDWLEGDTIVINLEPARPDSLALSAGPPDEEAEREYVIETIVARVGARSLYRLPPQDSTAQAGVDLPAVHYVLGDEITIHMSEGEVEAMQVVGQTRGVHLEPLRRANATGDTIPADTMGAGGAGGAGYPAAPSDVPPPMASRSAPDRPAASSPGAALPARPESSPASRRRR